MKKISLVLTFVFAFLIYPSQIFAAETPTLQTQLMNYLPYILIGGATILLISIVGILLSKKKENTEATEIPQTTPVAENTQSSMSIPPVQTSTEKTIPPVQPVNMEEISNNLYNPVVAKPTIQETMEASTSPIEEQPIVQPEITQPSTIPVTEQTQSSDLQDILQREASASPMSPVTNQVMEETPSPVPATPATQPFESPTISNYPPFQSNDMTTSTTPVENSFNQPAEVTEPVVEIPNNTVPDLQQFVNNQVAEVPPMTSPVPEPSTPAVPPVQGFNPAPIDTDTTPTPPQTGAPFSI